MTDRILCVDDDPKILRALKRQLGQNFELELAESPQEGLEKVTREGPFAVVVSDYRMPGMNGVQFLCRVRNIDPVTVRMLLTGFADVETTIEAINEGSIFRFLAKPCSPEAMAQALASGLAQYRLQRVEQELLENTLNSCVSALTQVLSMTNPVAFGRVTRIKHLVHRIGQEMAFEPLWQLDTATMVSPLGCVAIPQDILARVYNGEPLTVHDESRFRKHPRIGHSILAQIPRLEEVARIVAYQGKHFDGGGYPRDECQGDAIPLGARILKAVIDFDTLTAKGVTEGDALTDMRGRVGHYDPEVLAAMGRALANKLNVVVREICVDELRIGMVLAVDVRAENGSVLITKGHEVTHSMLARLKNFQEHTTIQHPLYVEQQFGHAQDAIQPSVAIHS